MRRMLGKKVDPEEQAKEWRRSINHEASTYKQHLVQEKSTRTEATAAAWCLLLHCMLLVLQS